MNLTKIKELEINIQKDFNHILGYAFPLCIMLSEKKLLAWYYENYIGLYGCLRDNLDLSLDIFDALTYTFIETRYLDTMFVDIHFAANIKDIIREIKQRIFQQNYIIIYLDEYYISERNATKNYHFVHEFLIYGYDSVKKIFKVIAFDKDKLFTSIDIDYEEFHNAYINGFKYAALRKDNNMIRQYIMYFKIRDHETNYPFSIKKFYNKLLRYYNGKFHEDEIFFRKLYSLTKVNNISYGINTYDILIDYLKNLIDVLQNSHEDFVEDLNSRYGCFHLFYQHKMGLYKRFMYIKNNFKLLPESYKILDEYKKIYISSDNIRMFCLKIIKSTEFSIKNNNLIENISNTTHLQINVLLDKLEILKNQEENIIKKTLGIIKDEIIK